MWIQDLYSCQAQVSPFFSSPSAFPLSRLDKAQSSIAKAVVLEDWLESRSFQAQGQAFYVPNLRASERAWLRMH